MLAAAPWVALGVSLASLAGVIILAVIVCHPAERTLKKRARKWRLSHPRT